MQVLVAAGDDATRAAALRVVESLGWPAVAAEDGARALATLTADAGPDAAVLDCTLPGVDGIEVVRRVRAARGSRYAHLVLLHGRSSRADLLSALRAGADDLLAKPVEPELLSARLEAGRRLLDALSGSAASDALTGLPGREAIAARLVREAGRCARAGLPLSLVRMDLLRLGAWNGERGRAAGDAVLRSLAAVLRAALRENDGVGRYGGSEFLLALPGCDESGAARCAERLQARLAAAAAPMRIAIGCATSHAPEFELDPLVAAAGAALDRAKRASPAGWAVATAEDWSSTRT